MSILNDYTKFGNFVLNKLKVLESNITKVSTSNSTVVTISFGYANVKDFGAVGDGTTDDTNAFTTAIATGKSVYVPKGTYKTTGSLTLQDDQMIFGDGYNSIIRYYGTLRNISVGNRSVIKDLQFVGNGKASGNQFETGVFCYQKIGWLISNVYINGFGGNDGNNGGGAIDVTVLGSANTDGARISNCYLTNNNVGLNIEDRGEYVSTENCLITNNIVGVSTIAGNLSFVNCNIQLNTTGVKCRTGANDGHSSFVGCKINHNTTNLDSNGITQGNSFVGCHFYNGNIVLTSNTGLRFTNCDFRASSSGANSITLTTNTSIQIANSRLPKNPTTAYMTITLVSGNAITEVNNLDF